MLPFYDLVLGDDPEAGVDMLGLVDEPAHMKDYLTFGKDEPIREVFNEEKRIITGVLISANTWIYRNDPEIGEHYVRFTPETIAEIQKRFHKNQFGKNVNLDHDPAQPLEGVYMISDYLVDEAQGVLAPNKLDQKVPDGSWIGSYYAESAEAWEMAKERNGFSIEGLFNRVPVDVKREFKKTNNIDLLNKLQEMEKSILNKVKAIFNGTPEGEVEEKMGEATTDGGVVVMWDGALEAGTMIMVEVDGEPVPAPEGAHSLTGEFEGITIVLDGDGMVTEIIEEPADESPEDAPEEAPEEAAQEQSAEDKPEEKADEQLSEAVEEMAKLTADKFKAVEAENKSLKELNEAQAKSIAELMERVEKLEKTPITPPKKKKFKSAEPKEGRAVNPIINNY